MYKFNNISSEVQGVDYFRTRLRLVTHLL